MIDIFWMTLFFPGTLSGRFLCSYDTYIYLQLGLYFLNETTMISKLVPFSCGHLWSGWVALDMLLSQQQEVEIDIQVY